MPIADMIGVICPFPRSLGAHDIYGFRCFLDSHDRLIGLQDHAVALLQDRTARERNAELESRVGCTPSMPLPSLFPSERKSFMPVTGVLGVYSRRLNDMFNNCHDFKKGS